jgi:PHP family Zn ribbon phosphoesterase
MAKNNVNSKMIELIMLNREGKLKVKPGFDGEYGKVLMPEAQGKLF